MLKELKEVQVISQSEKSARVFIDSDNNLKIECPIGVYEITKIGHVEKDCAIIYFENTQVHVKCGATVAKALFNTVKKERSLIVFENDEDYDTFYNNKKYGDTFEIVISSNNRIKAVYKYN